MNTTVNDNKAADILQDFEDAQILALAKIINIIKDRERRKIENIKVAAVKKCIIDAIKEICEEKEINRHVMAPVINKDN